MYCSLDQIDIELAPQNGRPRVVQTDHRTASEMAAQLALSQIAVLIRCLNPRRQYRELDLFYNFAHEPPQLIDRLVRVAGAHVWVGNDASFAGASVVHQEPDQAGVDVLANAAFGQLGASLVSETGSTGALRSLTSMEAHFARTGFPEQSDEASFWFAVLELGALTARAIHLTNGGAWTVDLETKGTFPLSYKCAFKGELATVNPLGRALKFVRAKGDGEEPSALVRMLAAAV